MPLANPSLVTHPENLALKLTDVLFVMGMLASSPNFPFRGHYYVDARPNVYDISSRIVKLTRQLLTYLSLYVLLLGKRPRIRLSRKTVSERALSHPIFYMLQRSNAASVFLPVVCMGFVTGKAVWQAPCLRLMVVPMLRAGLLWQCGTSEVSWVSWLKPDGVAEQVVVIDIAGDQKMVPLLC